MKLGGRATSSGFDRLTIKHSNAMTSTGVSGPDRAQERQDGRPMFSINVLAGIGAGSMSASSSGRRAPEQRITNSTGMPKVPSMLFDIDMETDAPSRSTSDEAAIKQRLQQVVALAAPCGTSVQVATDVATALRLQDLSEAGDVTAEQLAEALIALGYPPESISIRHSLGGGEGGECLRNLRHTFLCLSLDVAASCILGSNSSSSRGSGSSSSLGAYPPSSSRRSSNSSGCIIIDPTFQEQFRTPVASPRYSACLAALPRIFVGGCEQVKLLVELMCAEMVVAFSEQGVQLPPWRRAASMLSKWLPRKSCDLRLAYAEGPLDASGRPVLAPVVESSRAARHATADATLERLGSATTATSSSSSTMTGTDASGVQAAAPAVVAAGVNHAQASVVPPRSSNMGGVVGGLTRAMANAGRISAWLPSANSSAGSSSSSGQGAAASFEPLRRFVGGHFPLVPHQATQLM